MNNIILLQNSLLIKESNGTSSMTLTLLPTLQHACLICCSSAAFAGEMLSTGRHFCKQELAAFIHRNT